MNLIGYLTLIGVWVFAQIRGGACERLGATLIAAVWIATMALKGLTPFDMREMLELVSDFVSAAGLLVIAIAYSSRWLGVAMLLQSLSLALHAAVWFQIPMDYTLHVVLLNLINFGMLWCIAAATAATWWTRRRKLKPKLSSTPSPAVPSPA